MLELRCANRLETVSKLLFSSLEMLADETRFQTSFSDACRGGFLDGHRSGLLGARFGQAVGSPNGCREARNRRDGNPNGWCHANRDVPDLHGHTISDSNTTAGSSPEATDGSNGHADCQCLGAHFVHQRAVQSLQNRIPLVLLWCRGRTSLLPPARLLLV